MSQTSTPQPQPIVAKAGRYYRNARYIMFLLFMGFGLWCIQDGFYKWPAENVKAAQADQKLPHSDTDILLNRALGIGLPVLSIALLAWWLYASRGSIRLENNTLHAPGHPPIPLEAIREVDKSLWDRKGVAIVTYELPGGGCGKLKLDDFVYASAPVRQIMAQIESHLAPAQG